MLDYDLVNWLLYALKTGIIIAVMLALLVVMIHAIALIVLMCKAKGIKKNIDENEQSIKAQHEEFMARVRGGCRRTNSDITLPDSHNP